MRAARVVDDSRLVLAATAIARLVHRLRLVHQLYLHLGRHIANLPHPLVAVSLARSHTLPVCHLPALAGPRACLQLELLLMEQAALLLEPAVSLPPAGLSASCTWRSRQCSPAWRRNGLRPLSASSAVHESPCTCMAIGMLNFLQQLGPRSVSFRPRVSGKQPDIDRLSPDAHPNGFPVHWVRRILVGSFQLIH